MHECEEYLQKCKYYCDMDLVGARLPHSSFAYSQMVPHKMRSEVASAYFAVYEAQSSFSIARGKELHSVG